MTQQYSADNQTHNVYLNHYLVVPVNLQYPVLITGHLVVWPYSVSVQANPAASTSTVKDLLVLSLISHIDEICVILFAVFTSLCPAFPITDSDVSVCGILST